jgi:hypothetical protein
LRIVGENYFHMRLDPGVDRLVHRGAGNSRYRDNTAKWIRQHIAVTQVSFSIERRYAAEPKQINSSYLRYPLRRCDMPHRHTPMNER